jgi:Transmembrane family 220, helix
MVFRALNGLMAALFALAVAVQYNDPDPVRWMAIYGAACLVTLMVAIRGRAPLAAPVTVGLIALAWSLYWVNTSRADLGTYGHMFDAWEMKNEPIEEAREASGLLIISAWMAVVALRSRAKNGRATDVVRPF